MTLGTRSEQADFFFPVQVAVMRDWTTEIIEDEHPVLQEIWQVKRMVFASLSMQEYHHYMSLKWLDRELFMRDKALALIQK